MRRAAKDFAMSRRESEPVGAADFAERFDGDVFFFAAAFLGAACLREAFLPVARFGVPAFFLAADFFFAGAFFAPPLAFFLLFATPRFFFFAAIAPTHLPAIRPLGSIAAGT
jgi:hypothetical protein